MRFSPEETYELLRKSELAVIMDIEKFSIHDGPGIRTIPFFKGCPLRCRWCQNPETCEFKPELMQNKELCIGCGYCVKACKKGAVSIGENGVEIDRRICDCCGERVWMRDCVTDGDSTICLPCYQEDFVTCDECGRIVRASDAVYYSESNCYYCERCYEQRKEEAIHPYGYKPKPVFYGQGTRFFGVELEVDDGGEDCDYAEQLLSITGKRMYIKHDGSLDEGFEMVTHPMTLEYHCRDFPWQELTQKAVSLGYRSHQTSTCGLHIHVSKRSLGCTDQQQEETIARILYFFEEHWNELVRFSRRNSDQLSRWAGRYGRKDDPKELISSAKRTFDRYTGVNLTNSDTIEFRIFRGTLRYQTILAALQLVDEICRAALVMSDYSIKEMSWSDFVGDLESSVCPELIEYLKSRRLYINEAVERQEEL